MSGLWARGVKAKLEVPFRLRRAFWFTVECWHRLWNYLPGRAAAIRRMASKEWEMMNLCDLVTGQYQASYSPGAWWRLRRPV